MTSSKLTAGFLGLLLLIASCGGGKTKGQAAPATTTVELTMGILHEMREYHSDRSRKGPSIISVTSHLRNAIISMAVKLHLKIKEVVNGVVYTSLKVSPAEMKVTD
jgi:hypothetical protein